MLPHHIEVRVSSLNLEEDVKVIRKLMHDVESIVHAENSFVLRSEAVYGMGWYFYELSMNAELVRKLIDVYGKEIVGSKGKKMDQKFTSWFMTKLKERKCDARIKLKSEKEFRGFWPWLLK